MTVEACPIEFNHMTSRILDESANQYTRVHRSTLEAIWGGGKSICQKLRIWNNPLDRNYTMYWMESQVGWVVQGAIPVRAWDGFVRVRIIQGAFSTFFKFYQTFRACNFFQHILANSGFRLWYLAHFKELPELRLTTCSHLLIFHFYYIKMFSFLKFFYHFQWQGQLLTNCNIFICKKFTFKDRKC